jgi:hypothetical protein
MGFYTTHMDTVVYDAKSKTEAKLSSVLRNGDWFCSPAPSKARVKIQSKLPLVPIGVHGVPKWSFATLHLFHVFIYVKQRRI